MTGSALTGFWGERVRRVAQWLLEHKAVHVLATDAHDTEKRIPVLSTGRDAAAEICGEEVAKALVEGNPTAIIHSQPLPYFPRPVIESYRKSS
jgi:protein-tyrosine phosphatase